LVLLFAFPFVIVWAASDYLAGKAVTFIELAGLIVPLAIIAYILLAPYRQPAKMAAELWRDPVARQPLAGNATDRGITIYSSTSGSDAGRQVPGEAYTRQRQREDLLVMVTADGVLYTFPRSFFASQEDWVRFLELAQSKVIEAR
jgi:hypothetical protein